MIHSIAYDIFKREVFLDAFCEGFLIGFAQGELKQARKYACIALKVRFPHIPISILERVETITSLPVLDILNIATVTTSNWEEFEAVMTQLLKESIL